MLGCEHTLNKSGDTRGSPTAAAAATDVSGVGSKYTAVNGRGVGAATRKAVQSCVKPSSHFAALSALEASASSFPAKFAMCHRDLVACSTFTAYGVLTFGCCCFSVPYGRRVALLLLSDLCIQLLADLVVRRAKPVAGPAASEAEGVFSQITLHLGTVTWTVPATTHR